MGRSIKKNSKILVALSGGVDSSVAAALLKKQGYRIEGAYMRCWSSGSYCTADKDQTDAAKVAVTLDIPFHVFNFEKEYKEKVMEHFFNEYQSSRTPNPDVVCNKEIKFGLFLKKAIALGFDYIATGHYSRIRSLRNPDQGRGYSRDLRPLRGLQSSKFRSVKNRKGESLSKCHLLAGLDQNKDQSYFLYLLGQGQLARTIFPLGELTKKEVRKLARRFALPTADKPDSTGICFIGEAPINEFLRQRIKISHGDVVSVDGKLLGRHIGLPFYTIGQREGLGISAPVPYYVASKNISTNTLIVAPFGHEALFKRKFLGTDAHWIAGEEPKLPLTATVKLRYRAEAVSVLVEETKGAANSLEVTLEDKQRALTPGQSAVFYEKEEVLGGVVIDRVLRN